METIKVTYNSIVRRFNIANSTTWAELESKLRSLYKIPTTSSLTVTYTDEDGDVITVSSDLELEEVLAQQSSGRPIKLVLKTVDDVSSDNENWVLENGSNESEHDAENKLSSDGKHLNLVEDSSSQSEEQQTTERKEENNQSRPPPYYHHVSFVDEDEGEAEDDQTTPLLQKEKEKEGSEQQQQQPPEPERTKDPKAQTNENDNNDDDDDDEDGIIFLIYCSWARPILFGPGFRSFGGPRFGPCFNPGSFGYRGSFYNPFVYGRPQGYDSAFFNGRDGPFTRCFGSRQCNPGQKSNACRRNSKHQSAEASTSASAQNRCNKNDYTSRPSCNRNFNLFNPCYGNQTQLGQEELDDKLSTLHSMGFDSSNDALYEDLLKRYNGNLERVIELLLRNQQMNEHYDNKRQKGIVINEEKARNNYDSEQNVEAKHDDGERSKPYVL